jgi:hypothetical protein
VTPRPHGGILGRRGLLIGVFALLAIALLGGRTLLHRTGASRSGIARVLDEFPGFAPATPARRSIGASGDVWAAYAAIARQAGRDWRGQFVQAGRTWQDGTWAVHVPPSSPPNRRAKMILSVGIENGRWVSALTGIRGLEGLRARDRGLSPTALAATDADLASCLAGAWGRSMIAPPELEAVATPAEARWIAVGARRGVPADCLRAVR